MQHICIAFVDMNSVKLAYCTGIEERIYICFAKSRLCGQVGVCDIYRLRCYRNSFFNDVQFDNIEYFAKTQLTPT